MPFPATSCYSFQRGNLVSRAKTVHFYATRRDLEPGLERAEAKRPVQYVARGLFPNQEPRVYGSLRDVPEFGSCPRGDLFDYYLILDVGTPVRAIPIPQRRGGILYGIDEVANPTALIIAPGGRDGGQCLIVGKIMASSDPHSQHLYRILRPQYLARFTKIGVYLVGPEALRLWKEGLRLTHSKRSPPEYDLHDPSNPQ
jgi:hypothetical protein